MTTATQLETIQTAVVGVGGYAGMELARLLLHHPRLRPSPPSLPAAPTLLTANRQRCSPRSIRS